jgi:hypothetical protein
LDGQLGDCKWLDEHITECSECLAEYEAIQHIYHLAQKTDFPPPESSYWKKFGTRVIARIAARPEYRPKRYFSFIGTLFARRLAVKLVTPLLVVLIAVLAVKLYAPVKKLRGLPSEPQVGVINQVDENKVDVLSEKADITSPDIPVIADVKSGVPVMANISADGSYPKAEPMEKKSKPGEIKNITSGPGAAANLAETEVLDQANSDDIIASYLDRRPIKTSYTRDSGLGSGIWTDLTANLKLTDFNTDQVIRFQILSGSSPSLAPLSSYREAAGKFFAPEISNSRGLFELNFTGGWGYASGDGDFSEDRLHHLKLELDLMKEK